MPNKTIVCLKWGTKYSSHYVNVLYNMCCRHSNIPFKFICFTDDPKGLNRDINIIILPKIDLQGWWYKPYIFSQTNNLHGPVLFLDLDIIIYDNIDKLWSFDTDNFIIIRDFTRHVSKSWTKFNSSVFRFNAENYYWIWEDFLKDYKKTCSKFHGDQDYIYSLLCKKSNYWPDNWIQSYKWEMRNKTELSVVNGKRNFSTIKNPNLIEECCIAVFHGDPNPHDVKDPWVIENWK